MPLMNYLNYPHGSWVSYFIRNSLDIKEFAQVVDFDAQKIDISLTINGLECDFESVVQRLGEAYESEVNLAAVKLAEDKMDKYLFRRLHSISEHAQRLEEEMHKEVQRLLADERKES